MRDRSKERVEHYDCPAHIAEQLRLAGGNNRFGEPNFRVIWGYNRIVPIHGEWQEFEQYVVKITAVPADIPVAQGEPLQLIPRQMDVRAGDMMERLVTKLKRSVIETRLVPKYLPGNCWHLEMWRPPEEYGTREEWGKLGEEVIGRMTIDTAGPYPERGEYELCYPLTHDGTNNGDPLPLITDVIYEIVQMIVAGRERFSYLQRRAALLQRQQREEEGFVKLTEERLRDGLRPFSGEKFVTVKEAS